MEKKIVSIITKRDIHYERIKDTEYAVYEETKTLTGGRGEKTEIIRGLASIKEITSISGVEYITAQVKAPAMSGGLAYLRLVKESDLTDVRSGKKHISKIMEKKQEEQITENLEIPEGFQVILWNPRSYQIMDTQGQFLALPILFNYIHGQIDNKKYNLEKLLARLKEVSGVCNKDKLEISEIPYYNQEDGRTKMIAFHILLDDETYNSLLYEGFDTDQIRQYILKKVIKTEDLLKKDNEDIS